MDGIGVTTTLVTKVLPQCQPVDWSGLVVLAFTRHQFTWRRGAAWCAVANLLPCVCFGHDGNAGSHRLGLCERAKCSAGATDPRQFHWITGVFRSGPCLAGAGGRVVCRLRAGPVDCRPGCRSAEWGSASPPPHPNTIMNSFYAVARCAS